MLACHITLSNRIFMHCLLKWSVYFVYYKTVLDTHQMRLVIVLFGLISLRFKIQSLSLLWSSCENFRPLAEAKCHTLWKMIVKPTQDLNPRTTITPAALTDQRSLTCYWHQTKDTLVSMSNWSHGRRFPYLLKVSHVQLLSFSKQRDTSLQRAGINFHTTISKQISIGSSKSMKFAYQTEYQPKHWPIVFSVRSVGIS